MIPNRASRHAKASVFLQVSLLEQALLRVLASLQEQALLRVLASLQEQAFLLAPFSLQVQASELLALWVSERAVVWGN